MRREDGSTLRDHLTAVEKQTGQTPFRLDIDPIPMEITWWFNKWIDLSSGRSQSGMGGPSPLTWVDMHAYASLFGLTFTQTDVIMFKLIDAAYFESLAAERERQDRKRDNKK